MPKSLNAAAVALLLFSTVASADIVPFPGANQLRCMSLGFDVVRCDDQTDVSYEACAAQAVAAGLEVACRDHGGQFRNALFARPGIPALAIALTPWSIQLGVLLALSLLVAAVVIARTRRSRRVAARR